MSVNKVILIGNAGRDPEVRYLDNGVAVATFTLATSERGYTLQNGTQVPERTGGTTLCFGADWPKWPKSMCARETNSTLKENSAPVRMTTRME